MQHNRLYFIKTKLFGKVNYIYYIQTDHLGTPRVILDNNNNLVWKWDYSEPFGNNSPQETGLEFNLRFPGQYWDSEKSSSYNINRDYNPLTGRYLQSDPLGLNAGINTYLYANGNPLDYIDEDGNMPSPPQGLVDFAAGFGDSISFGGTKFVRQLFEIGSVNNCSGYYLAGELTDVVIGTASLGGSIYLKSLVKNWKTISPSVRNNINKHKPYQSFKETGFDVHHIHPLKGHPGMPGIKAGQPTLFPTGGLPFFINSHPLNLRKVSNAEHIKLYLKLYKLEKFWEIYHSPIITGLKIENSILNQCECK